MSHMKTHTHAEIHIEHIQAFLPKLVTECGLQQKLPDTVVVFVLLKVLTCTKEHIFKLRCEQLWRAIK